jgi:hypothetical protein
VDPVTLVRIPICSSREDLFSKAKTILQSWAGSAGTVISDNAEEVILQTNTSSDDVKQVTKLEFISRTHPDAFQEFHLQEEQSFVCLITIALHSEKVERNRFHEYLLPQRLFVDLASGLPDARVLDGPFTCSPMLLGFDEAADWMSEFRSQSRPYPTVIIGMNEHGTTPMLDPFVLSAFLSGLAQVVYVDSSSTMDVITWREGNRPIRRDSVVLLGADEKTPFVVITKSQMMSLFDRKGRKPAFDLFLRLALRTKKRYPRSGYEWSNYRGSKNEMVHVTDEIADDKDALIQSLKSEIESQNEDILSQESHLWEMREIMDALIDQRDQYKKDSRRLKSEVDRLSGEFAKMRAQLSDLGIDSLASLFDILKEKTEETIEEYRPGSVQEVLLRVRSEFQSSIVLLDSAMKSGSEAKEFRHPMRVWEVFCILHEKHDRAVQMNRQKNQRVNLDELFRGKGLHTSVKFAKRESKPTMEQHGDTRFFLHRGKMIEMQPHLKIGVGASDQCLRIHFIFDKEEEKFLVGHCGKHLPLAD